MSDFEIHLPFDGRRMKAECVLLSATPAALPSKAQIFLSPPLDMFPVCSHLRMVD